MAIVYTHKTPTLHAVEHKDFYHLSGTGSVPDLLSQHVVGHLLFHSVQQNCPATAVTTFSMQDIVPQNSTGLSCPCYQEARGDKRQHCPHKALLVATLTKAPNSGEVFGRAL